MEMQQQGTPGGPGNVPLTPGCGSDACTPAQHLFARSAGMHAPFVPLVQSVVRVCASGIRYACETSLGLTSRCYIYPLRMCHGGCETAEDTALNAL